ncbi:MAG: Pseudouridine synthase [Myxococcaceae bacterium]|nr:Pseudouridine synthase [Myxococcaceae bacterium]
MLAPLLYEDASMIAVAKPAGVVVIPARGEEAVPCLQASLEASRGEKLWVVHRLDRDTSGVLLFARTAAEHRRLNGLFEGRRVQKRYLAWTRGLIGADEGSIDAALHPARKGKMRPATPGEEGALPSRTRYRVLRRWEGLPCGPVSEIEATPETGRQHQIRVHLRSIDAPLMVDPIYGRAAKVVASELGAEGDAVLLDRLSLHAAHIALVADTGAPLSIEAPLPDDLAAWRAALDDALARGACTAR